MNDLEFTSKLRSVLERHYMPPEKLPDGKLNPDCNPPMKAEAILAISCAVSIARIFRLIDTYESTLVIPVITDLSFGLNENRFWKDRGATIVPVFKHCLHAKLLEKITKQQNASSQVYDTLGASWKNIFVLIYDCLYGVMKATENASVLLHDVNMVL